MDNSRSKFVEDHRSPHADAVQRSTQEALTGYIPVGLRVYLDHDSIRLHQRVPHQYHHD